MKIYIRLFVYFTLILATPVGAEMYKHTDEKGVITYTDVETEGAKEIETPGGNTVRLPKYVAKTKPPEEQAAAYTSLAIISPEHDATIRDNTGDIAVTLKMVPSLKIKDGHTISVYLDSQIAVSKSTAVSQMIKNVDRGSHQIYAEINDASNKSLIKSDPVTVHLKRFSIHQKK